MERGYVLFNLIVSKITHSYVGLSMAVNLLFFIPFYLYISKRVEKKYWWLCVFIFVANPYMFIQGTFNILRQNCASGIVLIAVLILTSKKKKNLKTIFFFLLVLIATMMHRAAVLMIIIPIVFWVNWKRKYWYITLGAALAVNIVGLQLLGTRIAAALRFEKYLNSSSSLLNNPIYLIFIVAVVLYILYRYDGICRLDTKRRKQAEMFLFSLCFMIVSLPNDMVFRIYIMFAYVAMPGIPAICEGITKSSRRVKFRNEVFLFKSMTIMYYLCYFVGYVGRLALTQNSNYIPFKFFWMT
jgi:hypothetical protein